MQERHLCLSLAIEIHELVGRLGLADNLEDDVVRLMAGALPVHLWLRKVKILALLCLSTRKEPLRDLVESEGLAAQFDNGLHICLLCATNLLYYKNLS